uniref:SMP-30/Gluconolactonase/LRE-like region domain-containing protein n=1 Tax=Aureoumbra lagunensis TaxID=44058 RepID=A0A7S3K646_9STRA|mmetsp:Transcript_82/g.143  ORF Transcript_82/g.143 Transcript_82/m.143 type:complete len:406 (-) Transcript_82:163-1380(-)
MGVASTKKELGWVDIVSRKKNKLQYPRPQGVDENGDVFFIERLSHRIRKLGIKDGNCNILDEEYKFPSGGCIEKNKSKILIADRDSRKIISFDLKSGRRQVITQFSVGKRPCGVCLGIDNTIYAVITDDSHDGAHVLVQVEKNLSVKIIAGSLGSRGFCDGLNAQFSLIYDIKVDPTNGTLLLADGNRLRRFDPITKLVSTIAGDTTIGVIDGIYSQALFHTIRGIALDSDGTIYLCDFGNSRIRILKNGFVSTLVGSQPCDSHHLLSKSPSLFPSAQNKDTSTIFMTRSGKANKDAILFCPVAITIDEDRGCLYVGTADDSIASIIIPSQDVRRQEKRIQILLYFWLADRQRAFLTLHNTKISKESKHFHQPEQESRFRRALHWLVHTPRGAFDILNRILEFVY